MKHRNWVPTGGHKRRAWRLKKKHDKAVNHVLTVMNNVIWKELPRMLRVEAETYRGIGLFRLPIFDKIDTRQKG